MADRKTPQESHADRGGEDEGYSTGPFSVFGCPRPEIDTKRVAGVTTDSGDLPLDASAN
jgi:hypothetical protein